MLVNIYISNIVLIDKLELDFAGGLSVITGETGAGKSILLDALALALGARSDAGLIRNGADTAQVSAEFSIKNIPLTLTELLNENGIEFIDSLTMRRTLGLDGKSRAWVNDTPISVKTLKQIGDELVEIHGQFENHSLLDPTTHKTALDNFGGYTDLQNNVANTYIEFHAAEKKLHELHKLLEKSATEREFLEHNVRELELLNPKQGEEEELSNLRARLMDMEKNSAILKEAAEALNQGNRGIDELLFDAAHILGRIKTDPNPYQQQIDKLYELGESVAEISGKITPKDSIDINELESAEERLFAIRSAARKHRINADELSNYLEKIKLELSAIDNSDAELKKITAVVAQKKSEYEKFAAKLTQERIAASDKLRDAILAELPALKLGQADFSVMITKSDNPSLYGNDEVIFMIKTNPGSAFAPLHKIASGGELARLMLALRVVLMHGNTTKTFVFDEVDTGISGATASAVGERLARLAKGGQALVITHSAQVAGFGNTHFLISKSSDGKTTNTNVCQISKDERITELARIISGDRITNESIAMAKTLLKSENINS